MSGIEMNQTTLGWHGLTGDRRYAVRQVEKEGDFPWLTASKLPELLRYGPAEFDLNDAELLPTHVRTPSGELLDIRGDDLRSEISQQADCLVELMAFKHGIFDDATISVISTTTASHVCEEAGIPPDCRRFRANIEISCDAPSPFAEDDWVGSLIAFGETMNAPTIFVTKRDVRCKMIGLDPDTAEHDPLILKTVARLNDSQAGVYCAVTGTGTLRVGDAVFLVDRSDTASAT